jgi:hypothetical protein
MLIIIMCTCFNKVVTCVTGRKMSKIYEHYQQMMSAKLHSLVPQEKLMRTLQWALLFSQDTVAARMSLTNRYPKPFIYFLCVQ